MAAASTAACIAQLVASLARQRESLLRLDATAIADIEAGTLRIEQALAALSAALRTTAGAAPGVTRPSPAEIAQLRDELQASQATLSRLAAGNRRALDVLFGEATLYSR